MFIYSIRCEFGGDGTDGDADLVNRWLAWMRATHILEVLRSGALSAELIRIDTERSCFVVNYQFESAITFASYERDHAPRLRNDSLREFPSEVGLSYWRTCGEVVEQFPKKTED
ncbi:MAG: DUF4286 family protein [Mariniblastus sp.]|nr:DUF4286 family protein [Mariniblastus sp.]